MRNEKKKNVLRAFFSVILFSLLFISTIVLAGLVSLAFIGPNINAISNIILPLIIALPLAYMLFFILAFFKKFNWKIRYFIPALIFPILFGLIFGWTMHERDPKNIFKVFVLDPIPNGLSNVRAHDISGGFETEIVVAFNANPQVIDEIIASHQLEFDIDTNSFSETPSDWFPDLNWNQNWDRYIRWEKNNEIVTTLWVNPDKSEAVFWFLAY